ncbi:MAG: PaaI family thioesterase [Ktedonobacterales bacterium]
MMPDNPDDLLALGRTVLAAQPFSAHLGTQLTVFSQGQVELVLPFKPEFAQQFGFVHGGVISYLADNAITFAGGCVLGTDVLTAEYKINYVKPAQGERLIARAGVVSSSSRQAVCRCDILTVRDGQEYICAVAQGTVVKRGETSRG